MNCPEFEDRIALFAGDDLPPAEMRHVSDHLEACAPCRRFADGLRRDRAALAELAAIDPPDTAYAAVRAGVMRQVRPQRRAWASWAAAAALVAVTLALSMLWRWRTSPAGRPPMPSVAAKAVLPDPPRAQPPKIVSATRRAPRKTAQPMVVKIVTDDPNIVIYWISESTGDMDE